MRASSCNFLKKRFHRRCFSVNIAKFLKKFILKKICERLLLNNLKRNYSSMKIAKKMLNIFQHSQENTFTGVSFLINIVAACNLKVQSCKLTNNKYMIASIQRNNTEFFAFIANLVFKLLNRKVLFSNRKDSRNC